jgi:hypothetical protein
MFVSVGCAGCKFFEAFKKGKRRLNDEILMKKKGRDRRVELPQKDATQPLLAYGNGFVNSQSPPIPGIDVICHLG